VSASRATSDSEAAAASPALLPSLNNVLNMSARFVISLAFAVSEVDRCDKENYPWLCITLFNCPSAKRYIAFLIAAVISWKRYVNAMKYD
jgi:hypothetical protein